MMRDRDPVIKYLFYVYYACEVSQPPKLAPKSAWRVQCR